MKQKQCRSYFANSYFAIKPKISTQNPKQTQSLNPKTQPKTSTKNLITKPKPKTQTLSRNLSLYPKRKP